MRKTLTCPWCGGTMKAGDLESTKGIWWTPEVQKQPQLKDFLSWEGIKELCSPLTGNIRIPTDDGWEKAQLHVPAYHCPNCKVFLFNGMLTEEKK